MIYLEKVQKDLVDAMKSRAALRVETLRSMMAKLTEAQKSGNSKIDEVAILQTAIKQRTESESQFRSAGRIELADKEAAERAIIEEYLPPSISEEQVNAILIENSSETNIGKLTGIVIKEAKSKGLIADGTMIKAKIFNYLAGQP